MQNTQKLNYLYDLLGKAANLSGEFSGGYSNHFLSAQEFHLALIACIERLKGGDDTQLQVLWHWFAPTCDWDDLVGIDGQDLANEIFEILSEITIRTY